RCARAIGEGAAGGPVVLLFSDVLLGVTAMLAAAKAGQVFVPLDPSFPAERLRRTVEHAGARLILADAAARCLADSIGGATGRPVLEMPAIDEGLPDDNLRLRIDPHQVAYVIYTSGSTGVPKGVAQTHRGRLMNLRNAVNGLQLSARDRLIMLHSVGFSAA